jgi:hypothetical protein
MEQVQAQDCTLMLQLKLPMHEVNVAHVYRKSFMATAGFDQYQDQAALF